MTEPQEIAAVIEKYGVKATLTACMRACDTRAHEQRAPLWQLLGTDIQQILYRRFMS